MYWAQDLVLLLVISLYSHGVLIFSKLLLHFSLKEHLTTAVINYRVIVQGAAVTLTELGDYVRAVTYLEDLTKVCSLNWHTHRISFNYLDYLKLVFVNSDSSGETKWPRCLSPAGGDKVRAPRLWRKCCSIQKFSKGLYVSYFIFCCILCKAFFKLV